jgi:hypothetical protein
MAVSAPTSIGTNTVGGFTSCNLHTSASIPVGGFAIIDVACYLNGTAPANVTLSDNGVGLTWTKIAEKQGATQSNYYTCKFVAQVPAGLASANDITISCTVTANNWHVAGSYVTGQDQTSNAAAVHIAGTGNAGTANGWTAGNLVTSVADCLIHAVAHRDALTTSTPAAGYTELHDFQNPLENTTMTTVYQIVSSTGTYNAGGTWAGGTAEWVSVAIAIKAAGAGGGDTPAGPGLRRFPLGV